MLFDLHFLRPWWGIALLFILALPFIKIALNSKNSPWYKTVDSSLLKTLLISAQKTKKRWVKLFIAGLWCIAIIGLMGPAWDKIEVEGIDNKANIIVIAEMSRNLNINDIKPNRLERLKFKLYDLLEKTKDNNVAMMVYDDFPYIITPFTEDSSIITNFIKVFDIQMMPTKGARLEKALQKSIEMMEDYNKSNVILFIAGNDYNVKEVIDLAGNIKNQGGTLSIIAVGTQEPVPVMNNQGGFVKQNGNVITSTIDFDFLQDLAMRGGGTFMEITADDSDIDEILKLINKDNQKENTKTKVLEWKDMGVYIPMILLPFVLLLFRKGVFIFILCFVGVNPAFAFTWDDLWFNGNQQGKFLFMENPQLAAEKFTDKSYKAAAEYKSQQYEKALQNFEENGELYNAGNALAYLGRIDEAIKAYEKVLKQNPNHKDAQFNLDYLKKQQEQQKQQNQNQQKQKNQNSDSSNNSEKSENSESQTNSKKNDSEQSESEQKNSEQNSSEQNNNAENHNAYKSEKKNSEQNKTGWQTKQEQQKQQENKNNESQSMFQGQQNPEQKQWLEQIENNPYDLLRLKLRLIYEKEYNK